MRNITSWIVPAVAIVTVAGSGQQVGAQQAATFASAADATHALVQAVQRRDESALENVLGAGPDVTSSGDASADALERDQFLRKFQEMHRLVQEPNGMVVLYVGAENWPFPIPLASRGDRWSFDSKVGGEEILVRRIGEHESTAIDACRSLADTSSTVATALNNEMADGYRFRAVASGPPTAHVGPSGGHTISNVRFVAYPAQYRLSGVMTFIVTATGVVYQRDLGPETSHLATAMINRVPTSGWVRIPQ